MSRFKPDEDELIINYVLITRIKNGHMSVSVQYPHNDTSISMCQQRVFKLFSRNVFEYNLITDNAKAHSV